MEATSRRPRDDIATTDKHAMADAFSCMEEQVERGIIGCYGCATWNGFRVLPEARNHLSLEELVGLARDVGGKDHHFKVIQLPINLAMTEAVRVQTQKVGSERVSLLDAAHRLGSGSGRERDADAIPAHAIAA